MFFGSTTAFKGFLYRKDHKKKQTKQNKNGKVLNKPQMRLLLKISGGSRYVYRYIFGKKIQLKNGSFQLN